MLGEYLPDGGQGRCRYVLIEGVEASAATRSDGRTDV
jgi:hypothetical protein